MTEPNRITAILKVTAEFYDPDATPETVRACVEQDLTDAGYDVDVDCVFPDEETFCQYMARNFFPPNADREKVIGMNGKLALDYLEKCWKEHFGKDNNVLTNWISVKDRLPPEHDTIFAKLKGTDKWNPNMFAKASDDVRVVVRFDDGTRMVSHDHTFDGKWRCETEKGAYPKRTVTHWMWNPELPEDET